MLKYAYMHAHTLLLIHIRQYSRALNIYHTTNIFLWFAIYSSHRVSVKTLPVTFGLFSHHLLLSVARVTLSETVGTNHLLKVCCLSVQPLCFVLEYYYGLSPQLSRACSAINI